MIKVGLLSDTHAYWDDKYAEYFKDCDEIWHAGDIGSDLLAAKFEALKPFRAVYGNIDGQAIRLQYPKVAHFKVEDVNVMMTHIGGYPGRYNPQRIIRYTAKSIHLRTFAYPESSIRSKLEVSAYESGSGWKKWLSSSTYLITFRYCGKGYQRFGSYRARESGIIR